MPLDLAPFSPSASSLAGPSTSTTAIDHHVTATVDRANMYKVIPTGWYFDVNIWCYMGSLAVSAHIGHFPNLKIQESRVYLHGKIAVFYVYSIL